MLPRPRLVATDLDGTLVRSDGTVSDRTVRALGAVRDRGAEVVFVTGRPVRWMADVVRATGLAGTAICSNGAIVVDLGTGARLASRLLAPSDAVDLARRLRDVLPGVAFACEGADGFAREPSYSPRFDAGLEDEVAPLEELIREPLVKLLARHEGMSSDEMLAVARRALDGGGSATHSSMDAGGLIEVAAAGVTKASTLEAYAATSGLTAADVVAFGDMPNDLAMLAWAGRAYAMANAHPDVLAVAPRVTASNDEDGVARVLEELFELAG